MTDAPATCHYDLDPLLRLTAVSPEWDAFARDNEAPELCWPGPARKPVLDSIADITTVHLYSLLFARVRRRQAALTFPIRCDAPAFRRHLQLSIEPLGPGFRVVTTETRRERREPVALLDRRTPRRDDAILTACGWCNRILAGTEWLEVEDAIPALGLFEAERVPALSHGICTECDERVLALIDA